MLQRKTGHWVYSRVVPHYPITATCYCPTCMKMDLARCWCPRCHPEISLKSLHHFIFHEPSYQTSPVFPSQFHGYNVSARDCEFVFAMRSSLLSGRGCSRRGLDPSLCGGVELPGVFEEDLLWINTQIWYRTDQARSFGRKCRRRSIVPRADGSMHFIRVLSCRIYYNIWTFSELLS